MRSALLTLLCLTMELQAIRKYADELPNGTKAPNPCGGTWTALGHYKEKGGPKNGNGFGWLFVGAKKVWKDICKTDYDRDGKTNGEELGDPECVWTKGSKPASAPTGNPMICEPVNDPKCLEFNRRIYVTDPKALHCYKGNNASYFGASFSVILLISTTIWMGKLLAF